MTYIKNSVRVANELANTAAQTFAITPFRLRFKANKFNGVFIQRYVHSHTHSKQCINLFIIS